MSEETTGGAVATKALPTLNVAPSGPLMVTDRPARLTPLTGSKLLQRSCRVTGALIVVPSVLTVEVPTVTSRPPVQPPPLRLATLSFEPCRMP